jgi:hypothetical protein
VWFGAGTRCVWPFGIAIDGLHLESIGAAGQGRPPPLVAGGKQKAAAAEGCKSWLGGDLERGGDLSLFGGVVRIVQ